MPINDSDHLTFTRLYQNAALLHAEAVPPHSAPIVFGGYTISIAYALAFHGLENRLGLVAINRGAHPNPVYAGDRLSCFSEVIDKVDANPIVGLLRLRLIAVKNRLETSHALDLNSDQSGRPTNDPSVVLDLDYWEPLLKKPR
jgi:2-methylfumaryl-CoA hydratase